MIRISTASRLLLPVSPWPAGGGNIFIRDSAQAQAATHLVKLTP
jgi:hypothetical protein